MDWLGRFYRYKTGCEPPGRTRAKDRPSKGTTFSRDRIESQFKVDTILDEGREFKQVSSTGAASPVVIRAAPVRRRQS